jgi:hypothetical protein
MKVSDVTPYVLVHVYQHLITLNTVTFVTTDFSNNESEKCLFSVQFGEVLRFFFIYIFLVLVKHMLHRILYNRNKKHYKISCIYTL